MAQAARVATAINKAEKRGEFSWTNTKKAGSFAFIDAGKGVVAGVVFNGDKTAAANAKLVLCKNGAFGFPVPAAKAKCSAKWMRATEKATHIMSATVSVNQHTAHADARAGSAGRTQGTAVESSRRGPSA